ncbi:MAG: chemotaxis protein CheW [candidate division WOR-3 bacterium]
MNYYLGYQIGAIKFATEIHEIKEIIRPKTIIADGKFPKNIAGFCILRNKKIFIFDLPTFLAIKIARPYEVIVTEVDGLTIGFWAEKIYGILTATQLLPYPEIVGIRDYLLGIIKRDGELFQVLSFARILSGTRLRTIRKYL